MGSKCAGFHMQCGSRGLMLMSSGCFPNRARTGRSFVRSGAAFARDPMALDHRDIETSAIRNRTKMLGAVTVVTQRGERIKARGTAATLLDRNFPEGAAAALNTELALHSPTTTGKAAH
jgi:hypothetical protein